MDRVSTRKREESPGFAFPGRGAVVFINPQEMLCAVSMENGPGVTASSFE